ncbi:hypothetical protein MaudMau93_005716 [Microsporum audouinii]
MPNSGIYGCTFEGCFSLFGNPNAWAAHEGENHSIRESWRCSLRMKGGKECARLFKRSQGFKQHLKQDHELELEEAFGNICYLGSDYQHQFWYGFCRKAYPAAEEGFAARTERRKHVYSHFKDGLSVTEWVPAGGHKPNWASASDGVFQVVDFPPFDCAILKEGVIYKAQAIAY